MFFYRPHGQVHRWTEARIALVVVLVATVVLTGCARTQAIKDLERDKVVVIETGNLPSMPEDIWQLAQHGCAIHERIPKPVSTHIPPSTYSYGVATSVTPTGQVVSVPYTTVTAYNREHLFACIDPGGGD